MNTYLLSCQPTNTQDNFEVYIMKQVIKLVTPVTIGFNTIQTDMRLKKTNKIQAEVNVLSSNMPSESSVKSTN